MQNQIACECWRESQEESEPVRERERGVGSGIVLLESVCVCVCPPHLPVEKPNGLVWFPGDTLPLCSICSTTRHPINR